MIWDLQVTIEVESFWLTLSHANNTFAPVLFSVSTAAMEPSPYDMSWTARDYVHYYEKKNISAPQGVVRLELEPFNPGTGLPQLYYISLRCQELDPKVFGANAQNSSCAVGQKYRIRWWRERVAYQQYQQYSMKSLAAQNGKVSTAPRAFIYRRTVIVE